MKLPIKTIYPTGGTVKPKKKPVATASPELEHWMAKVHAPDAGGNPAVDYAKKLPEISFEHEYIPAKQGYLITITVLENMITLTIPQEQMVKLQSLELPAEAVAEKAVEGIKASITEYLLAIVSQ